MSRRLPSFVLMCLAASTLAAAGPSAGGSATNRAAYIAYVSSVVPGLHWTSCGAWSCGSGVHPGDGSVLVDDTGISLDSPLLTDGTASSSFVAFGIEAGEVVGHFAGAGAARWLADEVSTSTGSFFLVDASRTFGTWKVGVGQLSHSGNDVLVTLAHL